MFNAGTKHISNRKILLRKHFLKERLTLCGSCYGDWGCQVLVDESVSLQEMKVYILVRLDNLDRNMSTGIANYFVIYPTELTITFVRDETINTRSTHASVICNIPFKHIHILYMSSCTSLRKNVMCQAICNKLTRMNHVKAFFDRPHQFPSALTNLLPFSCCIFLSFGQCVTQILRLLFSLFLRFTLTHIHHPIINHTKNNQS